jgi:DNA end-binding protein Ku
MTVPAGRGLAAATSLEVRRTMPRAMWKGAISFGLVSIPVGLYPATEEKTLRFNQLHDKDFGRIKYHRTCAKCGEEVTFDHIVKGYEYEKDTYVVLEDEDFDAVPVESSRAIDILQFVDLEEIDPIYFQKSYYLVPEETGLKAYTLLRQAMSEDGRVAIAKIAFRDKEHLAALRFKDNVFVLETMFWPDEIRAADFEELDKKVNVRLQEIQMAKSLIESLTDEFKPEQFRDEYREALLGIIGKKVSGEEIEVIPEAEPTKVVDLMEALKASVAAQKQKKQVPPPAKSKKSTARQKKAAAG